MKLPSSLLVSLLVSLGAAALSTGCTTAVDDDGGSVEDDIIRFPTGIFANTRTIEYGQTLKGLNFTATDKFDAVRFVAAAGDRIVGTVDAGDRKALVYVARAEGAQYLNVKAGGTNGDASNVVTYPIETAGEYFLVYRTAPRVAATFSVSLAKAETSFGACADAGTAPTLAALVGSVSSGTQPAHQDSLAVEVERRECYYATGCLPYQSLGNESLVQARHTAKQQNGQWQVVTTTEPSSQQPEITFGADGTFSGSLIVQRIPDLKIPVRGSFGPSCFRLDEAFHTAPIDDRSYFEYHVVSANEQEVWSKNEHRAAPQMTQPALLEAIPDEEVLARFPRGTTTLWVNQTTRTGVGAGESRTCHPLTSCSQPISVANEACRRFEEELGSLWIREATVSGRDSYRLDSNHGDIVIEDGTGTVKGTTIRLGQQQIQIVYPTETSVPNTNDVSTETSALTCTFPFVWPALP